MIGLISLYSGTSRTSISRINCFTNVTVVPTADMMIVILGDIFKAYYNLQETPIQTI